MRLSLAVAVALCAAPIASADIIDFENAGTFPAGLLSAVTPVTTGNFVITTSSNAEITNSLSATLPGIGPVSRGLFAPDALATMSLQITRLGGGLFEFVGLDWGFDSAAAFSTLAASSTVSGDGGTFTDTILSAGTLGDTAFSTFSAAALFGQSISVLDITFSATGAPIAPGFFGLDNIELNPVGPPATVPEPSSFAILFLGGLGFWSVRRRRTQTPN
jgi:hypothetical protein